MKFQIEFTDDVIMEAHCDNISEQAIELELKASFSYDLNELNKTRALTNIEMIRNSLEELEFYIKDL